MKFFLLFIIIFSSCQDYNSNSGDKGKYGPVAFNETDPNFEKAYYIIQSRCVQCHSGYHNNWADFKSNNEWQGGGLVIPQDTQNSPFLARIINSGQAGADMPQGGSAIPNAEYTHLVKWVNEFQ